MSKLIIINDQSFCTIREAAGSVSYSHDYITRLAREHKIKAVQLNRRWYVQPDSLQAYAAVQQQEQQVRQKHLRLERLAEQKETKVTSSRIRAATHSPESVAVATVMGMFLLGSVVGSQFSGFEVSPNKAAVIVNSEVQEFQMTEVTIPSQALRPQFSSSNSDIFIDTGRSFDRPVDSEAWHVIQHE